MLFSNPLSVDPKVHKEAKALVCHGYNGYRAMGINLLSLFEEYNILI